MTVYLDSCIYRFLKTEEGQQAKQAILNSKGSIVYCYSEAHLYDLSRDKTEQKFIDMEHMSEICEDNCFHYKKGIKLTNITPREYYNGYEWNSEFSVDDALGDFSFIPEMMKSYKLDWHNMIDKKQLEESNMPEAMITNFMGSPNLYEFMKNMLSFSDKLEDQSEYKGLLQYLHSSTKNKEFYEALKIYGFDGTIITDEELFKESYLAYLNNNNQIRKDPYDRYLDCYTNIEMLGIVKGKPKKQKMMNSINDGRHSFFGALCDVVVSTDQDFVEKSKFLYKLFGIETQVLSLEDFLVTLENEILPEVSLQYLMTYTFDSLKKNGNLDNFVIDEEHALAFPLKKWMWGVLNSGLLYLKKDESGKDIYHTLLRKSVANYSAHISYKEIKYIVDSLYKELGGDINGNTQFDVSEFNNGNWIGRIWNYLNYQITLNIADNFGLILMLSATN